MIENHYEILKIPNYSDDKTIKDSYKLLLKSNHPDKGGNSLDFIKIRHAYEFLTNNENKSHLNQLISLEEETFEKAFLLDEDEFCIIDKNNEIKEYEVNNINKLDNEDYIEFNCCQCHSENKIQINRLSLGYYITNASKNTTHTYRYLAECSHCSIKYKIKL